MSSRAGAQAALQRRLDAVEDALKADDNERKYGRTIAIIGAIGLIGAASVTGIFSAVNQDEPAISCATEATKVIELVEKYPGVWVPMDEANPIEAQCNINDIAQRASTAQINGRP